MIQGEAITIRTLTVAEAEEYFESEDKAMIIIMAVVDPDTKELVFSLDDLDTIQDIEAGFGLKLRLAIQRFNGFLEEEEGEEK